MQVYHLYVTERLAPKAIASRLKKRPGNIYVHLHNLKKKGALNIAGKGHLETPGEYLKDLKKVEDLRLDAQQWKIRLLYASDKYLAQVKKENVLPDFLGNYVVLYKDFIEVYSRKAFYDEDADGAARQAATYWLDWARKLENRLGVIIIKQGYQNWKMVKSGEYAREDSNIARTWVEAGETLAIKDPNDGKTFYWVDWSKAKDGKGPEDETVHPVTSKLDREEIDRHYVAWHLNPGSMTTVELDHTIKQQTMVVQQLMGLAQKQLEVNAQVNASFSQVAQVFMMQVQANLPKAPEQQPEKPTERPHYFG